MATLEQQLLAIMDQHGLNHLGLSVYTLDDGTRFFGANAHSGGICGSDNSSLGDNLVSKLNGAIADLNAKRAAPVIAELPALNMAEAA